MVTFKDLTSEVNRNVRWRRNGKTLGDVLVTKGKVMTLIKLKNFLILLIFLGGVSVFVCLFSNNRSSFHSILTETHKQLENLKHLQAHLKRQGQRELIVEEKYLTALGFNPHPNLLTDINSTLPVIVTAITPDQVEQAETFIQATRRFLPDHCILIYSLNLEQQDVNLLNKTCNLTSCTLRRFNLDFYPKHVTDLSTSAYRPLIIQDALNSVGAVIWLDAIFHVNSNNLQTVIHCARQHGIASWAIDKPTSALTHPRMFDFFHTLQENYYFHRMIESSHIVIYNTAQIHYEVMLPWVQCMLIADCVAPIGAQRTGCRIDKRPVYRYSGCHRYDESALNIVLGIVFNYDASPYLVTEVFFHTIEKIGSENSTLTIETPRKNR